MASRLNQQVKEKVTVEGDLWMIMIRRRLGSVIQNRLTIFNGIKTIILAITSYAYETCRITSLQQVYKRVGGDSQDGE